MVRINCAPVNTFVLLRAFPAESDTSVAEEGGIVFDSVIRNQSQFTFQSFALP